MNFCYCHWPRECSHLTSHSHSRRLYKVRVACSRTTQYARRALWILERIKKKKTFQRTYLQSENERNIACDTRKYLVPHRSDENGSYCVANSDVHSLHSTHCTLGVALDSFSRKFVRLLQRPINLLLSLALALPQNWFDVTEAGAHITNFNRDTVA